MPSRAMLLTGRSLRELPEDGGQEIPANLKTLPETLRAAGYRTCGVGKWHNGADTYHRLFDQGDAIFFGGMHHDHHAVPFHAFAPDGVYPPEAARARGIHSSTAIADAVIAQVDAATNDQPLFTWSPTSTGTSAVFALRCGNWVSTATPCCCSPAITDHADRPE